MSVFYRNNRFIQSNTPRIKLYVTYIYDTMYWTGHYYFLNIVWLYWGKLVMGNALKQLLFNQTYLNKMLSN